jgi:DNA-binding response OmpR family regulator
MASRIDPEPAPGKEILLVEDEVLLCWILEEALRDDGYGVHIATTGDGGMEALESGRRFSALITNIRLKDGPDGWTLARRAREIDPAIPVLYVSGDSAAQHREMGVEGSKMLSKPFQPDALHDKLAELLQNGIARP